MPAVRGWTEKWVDRMGLIVTLSGTARFAYLDKFKADMKVELTPEQIIELKVCLCERFTPGQHPDCP